MDRAMVSCLRIEVSAFQRCPLTEVFLHVGRSIGLFCNSFLLFPVQRGNVLLTPWPWRGMIRRYY